jgi:pyruvate dehydrogenase E1 component
MKKLNHEDLAEFRDRLQIPFTDAQLDDKLPPYFHPGDNHEHIEYLHERRRALGGYVPSRRTKSKVLTLPGIETYKDMSAGSGTQPVATTMAFVRLLRDLVRDKNIGKRIVPIIPDEARTFGMDSFFPTLKIYSPHGQQYLSVDRELMLSYKESESGQILHEGINEAGSVASWTAVATSYATHDEPMIPIYVFYSMFGFQRTGDSLWLAGDQMSRGFVIGATAGRTTLNGEGLQHQDGHSHLLASTIPNCRTYDVAFRYEVAVIVQDGLKRMYVDQENCFYYMTLGNENYDMPEMPAGAEQGACRTRTAGGESGGGGGGEGIGPQAVDWWTQI